MNDEEFNRLLALYHDAVVEDENGDGKYEASNAYWTACEPYLTDEDHSLLSDLESGRYAGGGKGITRDLLDAHHFLMVQKHNRANPS